jgi:predicted AAA+ superfamily ATPase
MYIHRRISPGFHKLEELYGLIALAGPRQVGKTTFLQHEMREREHSYVLLDDPSARSLLEKDPKGFEREYVEGHELTVLDEVQYSMETGQFLKYLVDTGHRLWITSSSAILLRADVLSFLVGRVGLVRLLPFNVHEFLEAKGIKTRTSTVLQSYLPEHIEYGGFPEVVLNPDPALKRRLLVDILDSIVLRDAVRAFGLNNVRGINDLVLYLSQTIGGPLNISTTSNALGMNHSTIEGYLDALEMSYIIARVRPFFSNKVKEIVRQPKVFFVDTGIRNAAIGNFPSVPDGHLFENYVYSELLKMGLSPKYWRTKAGAEVDFVLDRPKAPIPIEVKLKPRIGRISRGLRSFIRTYGPEVAYVVGHETRSGQSRVDGCDVRFSDILGLWGSLVEDELPLVRHPLL